MAKPLIFTLAVLLYASQFAFAVHELEHLHDTAGSEAELCQLCLHAGAGQHGSASLPPLGVAATGFHIAAVTPNVHLPSAPRHTPPARASPL